MGVSGNWEGLKINGIEVIREVLVRLLPMWEP